MFKKRSLLKWLMRLCLLSGLLLLVACQSNSDSEVGDTTHAAYQAEIEELERDNAALKASITQLQKPQAFSYLEQLPEDKRGLYQQFLETEALTHLTNFSPEEMLLVFLHSVATGADRAVYLISYDDGSLPNEAEFQELYHQDFYKEHLDVALDFRYYHTLAVEERQSTKTMKLVKMDVSFELFSASIFYGFKAQDQLWKIDLFNDNVVD